jgi:uncharacterized protein (TIGR02266 family)
MEVDGQVKNGTLVNLSETGLLINMPDPPPRGTVIVIPMKLSSGAVRVQGRIAWSRMTVKTMGGTVLPGAVGVELYSVPVDYLNAVSELRRFLKGQRHRGHEERYEVFHKVRFESQGAFLTEYTENLSRGGMYLATAKEFKVGDIIQAKIEITGIPDPIAVSGRVTYRLDAEQAAERGRTPGVGIQFVNLSDSVQKTLQHYIQRLSIHRSNPERRLTSTIPSAGSLTDYLVPELLLGLFEQEASGILKLEHKSTTKRVYLRNGRPVFVDSTLPSETLGRYLGKMGVLSLADMKKWLKLMELPDVELGKQLIAQNLVPQQVILDALIEYQEERLTNMFPWFEGNFSFEYGTDWPGTVSILPLQAHRIVFSGIVQWYDPLLLTTWMGLGEDCYLRRVSMPPPEIALPDVATRILHELWVPHTIKRLSEVLEVTVEIALASAYALIISKWVALEFSVDTKSKKKSAAQPKPHFAPPQNAELENWKLMVEEDFQRLRNFDYFKLLGVTENADEAEINQAFLTRTSRYASSNLKLETSEHRDLLHKVAHILSWVQTGRDTLTDPNLRFLYEKERRPVAAQKGGSFETEHALLVAMSEMNEKKFKEASLALEPYLERESENAALLGWYAWAILHVDEAKNSMKAHELFERAINIDPSDPQLHYFQGEFYRKRKEWRKAESAFLQAVRLQANFAEARAGLEAARNQIKI